MSYDNLKKKIEQVLDRDDVKKKDQVAHLRYLGYSENDIAEMFDRAYLNEAGYLQSKTTRTNFEMTLKVEHG